MGDNTLTTAIDSNIIPAAHHNELVSAFKDNLVPRDTASRAAADLAGDLGTTSFRWKTAYLQKIILGAIASNLSIEEDGSNRIILKVGGLTALTLDNGGLIPDSIITDMITDLNVTGAKIAASAIDATKISNGQVIESKIGNLQVTTGKIANLAVDATKLASNAVTTAKILNANVTKPKLAALGDQVSGASGSWSTSGAGFTQVTNQSVTITSTGRPIWVGLVYDSSSSTAGAIKVNIASGSFASGSIKIDRTTGASTVTTFFSEVFTYANGATDVSCGVPLSSIRQIDVIGTGTHTFKLLGAANSGTLEVVNTRLVAYEL
jgi:hypothetical protein